MTTEMPLVSALCVTKGRPLLLERAITCFNLQSYPNKELVIVYEDDDIATKQLLTGYSHLVDLRIVEVSATRQYTLGTLRNTSINVASGKYICQWDDDDWHHPERIHYQVGLLESSRFKANVLSQWMVHDGQTGRTYLSYERPWEGSLLCDRSLFKDITYEDKRKGEDTKVITYLHSRGFLQLIEQQPQLYIYNYHGNNTWDRNHWQYFFIYGEPLSEEWQHNIKMMLNDKAYYKKLAVLLNCFIQ